MRLARPVALAALALLAGAGSAAACPACATSSTAWFRYTTILLSLVPLAAIGGVVWWIRAQVTAPPGDG